LNNKEFWILGIHPYPSAQNQKQNIRGTQAPLYDVLPYSLFVSPLCALFLLLIIPFIPPYRGEFKLRIPNPHSGDISRALVSEILRQAGISSKEWNRVNT